uniref:NADH-ubiquinone oxidoreductase chain 1 n=1 Tax=Histeromerus sp. QL-2013 TaxID=1421637 RepID=A0A0A6ZKV6_9HYME|nr:NADH dehydrogenase subunit 1 [Histeromerus sp. QL-2013]
MKQMYIYMLNNLIILILVIILMLISVAFLTLFERKILSYMHYRKGPNKVGFWGMLQPFSDALKLMSKEYFYTYKSNFIYYIISPMLMFTLITSMWLMYPFLTNLLNWNFNSLFFLCLMSMGVYGLMMSGWSSNSSFSLLGSIRSIAQSISYEVTFAISLLISLTMINSLNLNYLPNFQKYMWMFFFLPSLSLIMFISMLAKINRTPFDLSEGESELVSGFNVEYSSCSFVLIFLAEYSSIMFMMFIFNLMFFCSNLFSLMFYIMIIFFSFLVIWIRVTLPRIRYDYLMYFCWFYLLPYILIIFIFYLTFFKIPMNLNLLN